MTNSEFLDDLESRPFNEWTDTETQRLWELAGYRVPPPIIRTVYIRTRPKLYIKKARERMIARGNSRMKGAIK